MPNDYLTKKEWEEFLKNDWKHLSHKVTRMEYVLYSIFIAVVAAGVINVIWG